MAKRKGKDGEGQPAARRANGAGGGEGDEKPSKLPLAPGVNVSVWIPAKSPDVARVSTFFWVSVNVVPSLEIEAIV